MSQQVAVAKDHFLFSQHYNAEHVTGPLKSFNPTSRWHRVRKPATADSGAAAQDGDALAYYLWRSRDNRKGRHAVVIDPANRSEKGHPGIAPTNTVRGAWDGLLRMVLRYPVWDVSYDVAVVFTLGSVIWVVNAFFAWLPLAAPSTEFSGETTWASGLSALVGATVFEAGSVLLMLEAVNENRVECFGWAVHESLDGLLDIQPEGQSQCRHSHASRDTFVTGASREQQLQKPARRWVWWPTWYEVKTHYIREIGFLTCSWQMFGATVFWISGFTALPPVLNRVSLAAQNGIYWVPQVVGGVGFVVSSLLFMIEVQPSWYTPAPGVLGWHIGFWNLIGAVGFTLCGALGFDAANPSVLYALSLSTFIGSWAFLIGSVLQWYESLSKYPVWVNGKMRELAGPTTKPSGRPGESDGNSP